jgi:Prokaryotic Cytochrome C oxidase subunit IV
MTVPRRITLVWIVLLALTFGSFVIGIEQSSGFAAQAALIIIGIALFKVRIIGLHYMDLRSAPVGLRMMFEGYLLAVFTALAVIDLVIKP